MGKDTTSLGSLVLSIWVSGEDSFQEGICMWLQSNEVVLLSPTICRLPGSMNIQPEAQAYL